MRGGQILHDINGFVIDRIQSAGPGSINQNEEKIGELGNFETVATIRDIPDISFDVESFDVSTEMEAVIIGKDNTVLANGAEFDFDNAKSIDVISPFRSAFNAYNITKGVVLPYLTLESAAYRFGLRQNATQSFTFRGDSIYYTQGAPYYQKFVVTVGVNQVYTLAQTAQIYNEAGDVIYALGVCAKASGSNLQKRLFFGTNYTNTSTTVTVAENLSTAGYNELHVVYGTSVASISYTQAGNNPSAHTVHEGASVKPAAIRGKDIDLYVGTGSATPTLTLWSGVQSFEVNRRVNLDADEEFGNYHYVSYDYDTAEVTGSIVIKPSDPTDLFAKIADVLNVTTSEVAGPFSSSPTPLRLKVKNPDTGATLKTFYVPDARFSAPAIQGRVQSKLEVTLPWSSDSGNLSVFKGEQP